MMRRETYTITFFIFAWAFTTPTSALALNSFRAQHKLPPQSTSATLVGAA